MSHTPWNGGFSRNLTGITRDKDQEDTPNNKTEKKKQKGGWTSRSNKRSGPRPDTSVKTEKKKKPAGCEANPQTGAGAS